MLRLLGKMEITEYQAKFAQGSARELFREYWYDARREKHRDPRGALGFDLDQRPTTGTPRRGRPRTRAQPSTPEIAAASRAYKFARDN